jgi:hypothetical protein
VIVGREDYKEVWVSCSLYFFYFLLFLGPVSIAVLGHGQIHRFASDLPHVLVPVILAAVLLRLTAAQLLVPAMARHHVLLAPHHRHSLQRLQRVLVEVAHPAQQLVLVVQILVQRHQRLLGQPVVQGAVLANDGRHPFQVELDVRTAGYQLGHELQRAVGEIDGQGGDNQFDCKSAKIWKVEMYKNCYRQSVKVGME